MEETQQKEIINSASVLFQKYGIKKTTMEDIAGGASMGKSTLYYYFKSKNAVYDGVLRDEFNEFQEIVKCALSDYHSSEQLITIFIKSVFSRIPGFPNLLNALLDTEKSKKSSVVNDFELWQSAHILNLLKHGVEAGEFRGMDEEELQINSQAIGIAMFGIRAALINEPDPLAFERKIDSLIFLLLNGIGKIKK